MWFARFQILICEPQSIWRTFLVLSWLYSFTRDFWLKSSSSKKRSFKGNSIFSNWEDQVSLVEQGTIKCVSLAYYKGVNLDFTLWVSGFSWKKKYTKNFSTRTNNPQGEIQIASFLGRTWQTNLVGALTPILLLCLCRLLFGFDFLFLIHSKMLWGTDKRTDVSWDSNFVQLRDKSKLCSEKG